MCTTLPESALLPVLFILALTSQPPPQPMGATHPAPERRRAIDTATIRQAMHFSTLDGSFAVPYANLTSGVILTGFLIALGATEFEIGIVAALPLLGGLLQPLGVEIVRRRGGWRRPVVIAAILSDASLWMATIAAVLWLEMQFVMLVIIGIIALQQTANAFVGASWTSWMSDLIPPQIRGRFFGRRNFICNASGAVAAIGGGQFVERVGNGELWSFLLLIGLGMVLRYVSAYFLSRQPEPVPAISTPGHFLNQISQPLADRNFRFFLTFTVVWGFAVNLSAPFFTVYMMRTLGIDFGLIALFGGMATAVNLLGQRYWGPICDRYGNHQVMKLTGILIVFQPFWWLFTAEQGFGFYLMGFLNVFGAFTWAGFFMANTNLMMRIAPDTGKTSYFAVQAALGGASGALGPIVGGGVAGYLMAQPGLVLGFFPEGLKTLFLVSCLLRLAAWTGLLSRIYEPVTKPRINAVLLIRDTARTFNIQQGFNSLLHVFSWARDRYSPRVRGPEDMAEPAQQKEG
jgi:MFS family permease